MKCPTCGAWTEVLETRTRQDGTVRRRYKCANLHRFSTEEHICDPDATQPVQTSMSIRACARETVVGAPGLEPGTR